MALQDQGYSDAATVAGDALVPAPRSISFNTAKGPRED
jgi:hypothetical protein